MKSAHKTDRGKRREINEDSIIVDSDRGIFLLADGMGGHQAGEIASSMAVKKCYTYLKENLHDTLKDKDYQKILIDAVFKAHDAIKVKSKTNLQLMGMGTTLVAMLVKENKTFICHAGDSRAYMFRKKIKRLTRDHTVGDYLVEHGIMKQEEVPKYQWHTLTQAVGTSDGLAPGTKQLKLKPDDMVLLCSDGLTDMLIDLEIEAILKNSTGNPEKVVDSLIDAANDKGGRDNISVVIVSI